MSFKHGHLCVSGTRIEVFWVHEAEPSFTFDLHGQCVTLPSMAVHLPYLPGSPSVTSRVLTSFVPPAHNQGVSVAPLQGHALWKIFLPTTGSFYVIVCWLRRLLFQHLSADVSWETFSGVGLKSDCCIYNSCIPRWPVMQRPVFGCLLSFFRDYTSYPFLVSGKISWSVCKLR